VSSRVDLSTLTADAAIRRVLMLTPDYGFLDRRIAQEAGSLASRGVPVDIYPVFDSLASSAGGLADGVRLLARRTVDGDQRVSAYRRGRSLKRALRRMSPTLHRWAHIAQTLVMDNAALTTTEDEAILLSGEPYDAVFAHDLPMLPLATRLARRWGAAVICDLHEVYPEQHEFRREWWTYRSLKRLEAKYLPLADGILCVNPAVRDYVERSVAVKAPIGVVYNTVPYAEPRGQGPALWELFDFDRDRRVLAFAGSLRWEANLDSLIRLFCAADVEGWALAILGSGPDEEALRRTIDELDAADRVFMGRRVDQGELISVLASADAGVLPYVGIDFNHVIATPNKLFEYIQARLPILAADLPQVRQILEDHRNGRLVDFASAPSAVDGLRRFLLEEVQSFDRATLEQAARSVCWERDELVVLDVFRRAVESARSERLA
jgi:glycosyltransferase involved in cell wall biosynthesis